jgi:hypothetical protein
MATERELLRQLTRAGCDVKDLEFLVRKPGKNNAKFNGATKPA